MVSTAGDFPKYVRVREKGVRAARFSHRSGVAANFAGSAGLDDRITMAP